jgi:hypothetical protein
MGEKERREDGVSRRTALKRIGAGAAIAWSAPVLTSLKTPAFAQYPPPGCSQCAGDFCEGQTLCQAEPNNCLGGLCGCAQIVGNELECSCYCNDLCDNRTRCPNGQSDCPFGQTCLHTCCDDPVPVCLDPCPNPGGLGANRIPSAKRPRSGRTGLG